MDLTVRLFAGLRDRAGAEHLLLRDLQEPVTIATVKAADQLSAPPASLCTKSPRSRPMFMSMRLRTLVDEYAKSKLTYRSMTP